MSFPELFNINHCKEFYFIPKDFDYKNKKQTLNVFVFLSLIKFVIKMSKLVGISQITWTGKNHCFKIKRGQT